MTVGALESDKVPTVTDRRYNLWKLRQVRVIF